MVKAKCEVIYLTSKFILSSWYTTPNISLPLSGRPEVHRWYMGSWAIMICSEAGLWWGCSDQNELWQKCFSLLDRMQKYDFLGPLSSVLDYEERSLWWMKDTPRKRSWNKQNESSLSNTVWEVVQTLVQRLFSHKLNKLSLLIKPVLVVLSTACQKEYSNKCGNPPLSNLQIVCKKERKKQKQTHPSSNISTQM